MVGCVHGSGQRGGLDGLPTPLVVVSAGGTCLLSLLTPAFAPGSSEVAVIGCFFFFFFCLFFHNLPQLHMHAVIFSPL